jgi:iron(III) transport system ATP-binding protein
MTAFLSINDLKVRYDDTEVLRGVNLTVAEADFTAIVGPSGCGKTTLLRAIAGLERATSGDMRLGTQMLTTHGIHLAPHKRNIGWVPQDAALFPHLNVAENVAFGLATSLRGVKKLARADRVRELLELVSLAPLARRMPHELSGGQAQRVALARALANSPQLVLLDEPFAGLDPVLRSDLRVEVKAILAHARTAALLVTHDQIEALSLASHVALMHDGIIEQSGSPLDVYFSPSTLWCAEFLGEANIVSATASASASASTSSAGSSPTESTAASALGDVAISWMGAGALPTSPEGIRLMIRPESLALSPGRGWSVTEASFAGHDGLVTLTYVPTGLTGSGPLPDTRAGATSATFVKVLVPAREMPALGAHYDVKVIGGALAYPALN